MATLEETPKVVLHVTEGPQSGERFEFTDHQTCIIGRSPEAHIRLSENLKFSRFHCRLEVKPPIAIVVDLRNIYRADEMRKLGFQYSSIGRR